MFVEGKKMSECKRVIALDGGGVRGLFQFFLLQRMVAFFELKETSLYSHCDLIVGSSVGALMGAVIALGLIDDRKKHKLIIESVRYVFSKKNTAQPFFAPIYNGKPKATRLREIFGNFRMRDCRCPLVILTATIQGQLRVWKSWDPHCADMEMALLLDAASAAPTYFPPVKVQDEWLIDGGVICNTPIMVGATCVHELFPSLHCKLPFTVLSIGNRTALKYKQDIHDPDEMGLIQWFKRGVIDLLMGVNDDYVVNFLRSIYGEGCVIRIVGEIPPSFDDVTEAFQNVLKTEAERAMETNQQTLTSFFRV